MATLSMKTLRRPYVLVALGVVVVLVVVLIIALSGSPAKKTPAVSKRLPLSVAAAPKGIVSATPPNASGNSWILTKSAAASNLQLIGVKTGRVIKIVPTPLQSDVVAQAYGGPIGVGVSTATGGAVNFYNSANGALDSTVAVSGPVIDLVSAINSTTFYALVEVGANRVADEISSSRNEVVSSVPMPSDALAIAISPDNSTIYALTTNGQVSLVNSVTGKLDQAFLSGASPQQMALSPDGSTLYVLDGSSLLDNVAVVNIATQSIISYLPAPANCVSIEASIDDSSLVDFVGTSAHGNIQIFATGR